MDFMLNFMMFREKTEIILIITSKKFYNSRHSTNRISAVFVGVWFYII